MGLNCVKFSLNIYLRSLLRQNFYDQNVMKTSNS